MVAAGVREVPTSANLAAWRAAFVAGRLMPMFAAAALRALAAVLSVQIDFRLSALFIAFLVGVVAAFGVFVIVTLLSIAVFAVSEFRNALNVASEMSSALFIVRLMIMGHRMGVSRSVWLQVRDVTCHAGSMAFRLIRLEGSRVSKLAYANR